MTPHVNRINKRLRLGRPVTSANMTVTQCRILDKEVRFCTDYELDPIQKSHRRGKFYEIEELTKLRDVFPTDGVFVDFGANVGNHCLFAGLFLNPRKIIPVEPNPVAYNMLIQNVLLNDLASVTDMTKLGVGVSDENSNGFGMQKVRRNLGGARLLEGEGNIEVYSGDTLLAGEEPSLIKIDVEGMETSVLTGLRQTILDHRPILMIEVDQENYDFFDDWAIENEYEVVLTHQRYATNKNFIAVSGNVADTFKRQLGG